MQINFPFDRNVWYMIKNLWDFQKKCTDWDNLDSDFVDQLRRRDFYWMKCYIEELIPFIDYTKFMNINEDYEFKLAPQGDVTDIFYRGPNNDLDIFKIQITMAFPDWDKAFSRQAPSRNPGEVAYLERRSVSMNGFAFRGGDISKATDGSIVSSPSSMNPLERKAAWTHGILDSVNKKMRNTRYEQSDILLLVCVNGIKFDLIDMDLDKILRETMGSLFESGQVSLFSDFIFVDTSGMNYAFRYGGASKADGVHGH